MTPDGPPPNGPPDGGTRTYTGGVPSSGGYPTLTLPPAPTDDSSGGFGDTTSLPLAPDPPAGGRYVRGPLHREGGMGQVHLADDNEVSRVVALKEIKPAHADKHAFQARFVFEAEVTGRLEHPGIVPVYGFGRYADTGRPFYAMRFIDGGSLRDAVRRFHGLPPTEGEPAPAPPAGNDRAVAFRRLLGQFVTVCQTVAYAHSQGVIHRDLKPANVMVGPFGEVLVVDWGMARRLRAAAGEPSEAPDPTPDPAADPAADAAPTVTKGGTPAYWAPEQAPGNPGTHDERTDVYGLGAVLYEILTGRPPHPSGKHPEAAPSPKAAEEKRATGRPPLVDDILDLIARQALALRPADRFPSAGRLAAEVERWLTDQPIAAQVTVVNALRGEMNRAGNDPGLGEQYARQCGNLGLMLAGMGRDEEAVRRFAEAAGVFAALSARAGAPPRLQAEEANCHLARAQALDRLGKADEAEAANHRAAQMYRGLIAAHPDEFKANIATIIRSRPADRSAVVAAPRVGPLDTVDLPPSDPAYRPPQSELPAAPPGEPLTLDGPPGPTGTVSVPPPDDPARTRPPDDGPDADRPTPADGYTVLRELGRGGMGQVFLARDNVLGRTVAIKQLVAYYESTHAEARLLREMRVTAALQHPNIRHVYTYGRRSSDGRPFIVMEYLHGRSLAAEVRDAGAGPKPRLLSAVAQACDALHYAHTRGVIHRDPKPQNVMLMADGRAVVHDWGLARVVGTPDDPAADGDPDVGRLAPDDLTITREGAVVGTPAFMSPEQARGDIDGLGPASDIYAAGAGLFFVLTGRLPLDPQGGFREVIDRLLAGRIPRPREVDPTVPPDLDAVCAKAMAFRPEDRYPTAAALAADLRAWLAGRAVSVRPRGRLRRLLDRVAGRRG